MAMRDEYGRAYEVCLWYITRDTLAKQWRTGTVIPSYLDWV